MTLIKQVEFVRVSVGRSLWEMMLWNNNKIVSLFWLNESYCPVRRGLWLAAVNRGVALCPAVPPFQSMCPSHRFFLYNFQVLSKLKKKKKSSRAPLIASSECKSKAIKVMLELGCKISWAWICPRGMHFLLFLAPLCSYSRQDFNFVVSGRGASSARAVISSQSILPPCSRKCLCLMCRIKVASVMA